MDVAFTRDFFAFTNSGWALSLGRFYFIVDKQCACCHLQIQKQYPLWSAEEGVFRTQSNIYNRAFILKIINGLKTLTIFAKMLQCICSIGFQIQVRYWQQKLTVEKKNKESLTLLWKRQKKNCYCVQRRIQNPVEHLR